MFVNASLGESEFLYIADTENHRIRAISAVCSFPCENMGRYLEYFEFPRYSNLVLSKWMERQDWALLLPFTACFC